MPHWIAPISHFTHLPSNLSFQASTGRSLFGVRPQFRFRPQSKRSSSASPIWWEARSAASTSLPTHSPRKATRLQFWRRLAMFVPWIAFLASFYKSRNSLDLENLESWKYWILKVLIIFPCKKIVDSDFVRTPVLRFLMITTLIFKTETDAFTTKSSWQSFLSLSLKDSLMERHKNFPETKVSQPATIMTQS